MKFYNFVSRQKKWKTIYQKSVKINFQPNHYNVYANEMLCKIRGEKKPRKIEISGSQT